MSVHDKCLQLKELGYPQSFDVGATIGRGFADLGVEEFRVLPGNKLVSLMTGDISTVTEEARDHFFLIPTVDQLACSLYGYDCDIDTLVFKDQREWCLHIVDSPDLVKGPSLMDVFLQQVIKVLESQNG